jgi:hypothetical protein
VPTAGKLKRETFDAIVFSGGLFPPSGVLRVRGQFVDQPDGTGLRVRVRPSVRGLLSTLMVACFGAWLLLGVLAFNFASVNALDRRTGAWLWLGAAVVPAGAMLWRHARHLRAAVARDDVAAFVGEAFDAAEVDPGTC